MCKYVIKQKLIFPFLSLILFFRDCITPLLCPSGIPIPVSLEQLSGFSKKTVNITVKVRVETKSNVRSGCTNYVNWKLFDMHVTDLVDVLVNRHTFIFIY